MIKTSRGGRLLSRRLGDLYIEAVTSAPDRRKVHYYRYLTEPDGPSLGAVSPKAKGAWRALAYGPDERRPHIDRVDLGMHSHRHIAEEALHDYLWRSGRLPHQGEGSI